METVRGKKAKVLLAMAVTGLLSGCGGAAKTDAKTDKTAAPAAGAKTGDKTACAGKEGCGEKTGDKTACAAKTGDKTACAAKTGEAPKTE